MQEQTKLQLFFRDFIITIRNYRNVIPFIKKHKLWKGLGQYGWAVNFLIIVGALLGLKLYDLFGDWYEQVNVEGMSLAAIGGLFNNVYHQGYDLFVMGGFKYVILIVLEVIIFHFARKTLESLTGETQQATFKAFMDAQVRMIKVVFYCFVMEMVFTIIASTALSILISNGLSHWSS